jgi:hypothetical protein
MITAMIVRGPNARRDFHEYVQDGTRRSQLICEGDLRLVPDTPPLPHMLSEQRRS